jgi:heme/copper-type cytochrome/quinol oxidase subunit 2
VSLRSTCILVLAGSGFLGVAVPVRTAGDDQGPAVKTFEVTVRFRADRAGTFPITCSEYCGSGHRRMKASLVVAASAAR